MMKMLQGDNASPSFWSAAIESRHYSRHLCLEVRHSGAAFSPGAAR
ncbi:MAG: hypothetical protein HUK20_00505 [Fibrobacter sp.]|nr:hypothetical protein [Fibrobacter sp.]